MEFISAFKKLKSQGKRTHGAEGLGHTLENNIKMEFQENVLICKLG
jgi:hypothetical protein